MYQLLKILVKNDSQWRNVAPEEVTFFELMSVYDNALLFLHNDVLNTDFVYEPQLDSEYNYGFTGTVTQWLSKVGNRTLPVSAISADIDIDQEAGIVCDDLFNADRSVRPFRYGDNVAAVYTSDDIDDLLVTGEVNANMLASVNGYVHPTSMVDTDKLCILNANANKRAKRDVTATLLDFSALGNINIHPIDSTRFFEPGKADGGAWSGDDSYYYNIDTDLNDKFVMLVIGGRLHIVDEAYQVIGSNHIRIDLNHIDVADIIFETSEFNDYITPGLAQHINEGLVIDSRVLVNRYYMKLFLAMSNSFIVTIDCADVYVHREFIGRDTFLGYLEHVKPVRGILQTGSGKVANYLCIEEPYTKIFKHYHQDMRVANYIYKTTNYRDAGDAINDAKDRIDPWVDCEFYEVDLRQPPI